MPYAHARIAHGIRWRSTVLAALAMMLMPTACAYSPTRVADEMQYEVQIDTDQGQIVLDLDSRTAPKAMALLLPQLRSGGFDGVGFDWVRPHTEIRSTAPKSGPTLPSELDAWALGLDQQQIADAGAAMRTIQGELEPAWMASGSSASPQLQQWIQQWRATFTPDFLIGISRAEINAALGYPRHPGVATLPVRRGSVALVPSSAGFTTLALAIVLRDQPARDGRWVVVGEVRSGLDIAEKIALQPRVHPKFQQPVKPVLVLRTRVPQRENATRSSP